MRLLAFSAFLLLLASGCSFGSGAAPTPVVLPGAFPSVAPVAPGDVQVPLNREASELRRLRDEHARLIDSIPPTVGVTPTLTVQGRSEVVAARVRNHPEGVPIRPEVGSGWFDPELGIEFYRAAGGDWTPRRVRERHTHAPLFYFNEYPESVPNFSDGGIYGLLARELVFEAVDVLPVLGEPTPAMIWAFRSRIGWELLDSPTPVINVWTTFIVHREGVQHVYAVAGVMRMGLSSAGEGEEFVEYLVPGDWVGPVVVERVR